MHKREAAKEDTDYVRKCGDLVRSSSSVFVGGSVLVTDVHSNLQPDPNEQSAALLRVIPPTLNRPVITGETPAAPPVREGPASETVTVTGNMYASLLVSLRAAFVIMLGN